MTAPEGPGHARLTLTQHIQFLLDSGDGFITLDAAKASGVTSAQLRRAFYKGHLGRPYLRVYQDPARVAPTLVEQALAAQLRFPGARPCLFTAQALHELTMTPTPILYLAVLRGQRTPADLRAKAVIVPCPPEVYNQGLHTLPLGNRSLVTYTPAMTVVSLLKYSSRYGEDAFLEALRLYVHQGRPTSHLLEEAKRARIYPSMVKVLNTPRTLVVPPIWAS